MVFEGYFLAIGATCLRYDPRICIVAGVLAVVQYLSISIVADRFWVLNSVDRYSPFIYGAFSWSSQISRMILMLTASLLSAVVVYRTQELLRLSTRDPLTGLFNRGYFHERVMAEVSRARRNTQPLTIAMIDVDHFKSFNDTYGHAAGDQALRVIAGASGSAFRKTDIVGQGPRPQPHCRRRRLARRPVTLCWIALRQATMMGIRGEAHLQDRLLLHGCPSPRRPQSPARVRRPVCRTVYGWRGLEDF